MYWSLKCHVDITIHTNFSQYRFVGLPYFLCKPDTILQAVTTPVPFQVMSEGKGMGEWKRKRVLCEVPDGIDGVDSFTHLLI